jgi:hypothetical protein
VRREAQTCADRIRDVAGTETLGFARKIDDSSGEGRFVKKKTSRLTPREKRLVWAARRGERNRIRNIVLGTASSAMTCASRFGKSRHINAVENELRYLTVAQWLRDLDRTICDLKA